jgi:hypothetical protein
MLLTDLCNRPSTSAPTNRTTLDRLSSTAIRRALDARAAPRWPFDRSASSESSLDGALSTSAPSPSGSVQRRSVLGFPSSSVRALSATHRGRRLASDALFHPAAHAGQSPALRCGLETRLLHARQSTPSPRLGAPSLDERSRPPALSRQPSRARHRILGFAHRRTGFCRPFVPSRSRVETRPSSSQVFACSRKARRPSSTSAIVAICEHDYATS